MINAPYSSEMAAIQLVIQNEKPPNRYKFVAARLAAYFLVFMFIYQIINKITYCIDLIIIIFA